MPTLVLIRHGQSAWNLENRFTGWWDVDLTDKGVAEAEAAGEMLAAKGFDFDLTFTSVQTRAIRTLNIALEKMGRSDEHTSELQSLMRSSYAVFCLKKKKNTIITTTYTTQIA